MKKMFEAPEIELAELASEQIMVSSDVLAKTNADALTVEGLSDASEPEMWKGSDDWT